MSESFKLVNLTKDEVMIMPHRESSLLTWVLSGANNAHADAANRLIVALKTNGIWHGNRLVLAGKHTPAWQAAEKYREVHYGSIPSVRTNPRYVVNVTKGEYVDGIHLRQGSDLSGKLLANPLPCLLASGSFEGSKDKLPGNMEGLAGTWSGDSIVSLDAKSFLGFKKKFNEKVFADLLVVCNDVQKVTPVAEKMYLKELTVVDETEELAARIAPTSPDPVNATVQNGLSLNMDHRSKIHLTRGTNFVITGKLDRVRAEYEGMIQRAGHHLSNKINHYVDYLVVGERPGSVKLKDAERHGTKVISLQQLRTALGQP